MKRLYPYCAVLGCFAVALAPLAFSNFDRLQQLPQPEVVESDQSNEVALLNSVLANFKEAKASKTIQLHGPNLHEVIRTHESDRFLRPISVSNYFAQYSLETPTVTTVWKSGYRYGIHWPSKTLVSIPDTSQESRREMEGYPFIGHPDFAILVEPHKQFPEMLKASLFFLPERIRELNELGYDPKQLLYGFIDYEGYPKDEDYFFYGLEYGIDSESLQLRYAAPIDSRSTPAPVYYKPVEYLDEEELETAMTLPAEMEAIQVQSEDEWRSIWSDLLADVISSPSKVRKRE